MPAFVAMILMLVATPVIMVAERYEISGWTSFGLFILGSLLIFLLAGSVTFAVRWIQHANIATTSPPRDLQPQPSASQPAVRAPQTDPQRPSLQPAIRALQTKPQRRSLINQTLDVLDYVHENYVFKFYIVPHTDEKFRLYIIDSPDYGNRSDSCLKTHILTDKGGQKYICLDRKYFPNSLDEARQRAADWSACTARYIETGTAF
ncbi:MAG: hypothetical protein RIC85_03050 [Gammaproteobacteria bacterium]